MRTTVCIICLIFFAVLSKTNADKPLFSSSLDETQDAKICWNNLSPLIDSRKNYRLHFFYNLSVQVCKNEVSKAYDYFLGKGTLARKLLRDTDEIRLSESVLKICQDLFSLALDDLNLSLPASRVVDDLMTNFKTWLTSAGANLQACVDGLPSDKARRIIGKAMKCISTSLSILSLVDDYMGGHVESAEKKMNVKNAIKANIVVAADGSGNYKTISEAIEDVPGMSNKRFVIHVKRGVYKENVVVAKEKWNVMMYGDGKGVTIVSGNRGSSSGLLPLMTATFAVFGKGFVAMDMGFENTAGPSGGQALALLTASDQSVFYRCRIDGHQDTLRTHAYRQFYRECDILGAIDFIYGDAAAVIQNSNILVKRASVASIITAQGKDNPLTNTGLSLQNCTFAPAEDLYGVKAYLGRPWKELSTTVIMESQLGSLIDPQGWVPMQQHVDPTDTILYVEYNNRGPGAATADRVRWKGLKVKNTKGYASKFTVRAFINGDQWIPATGVPFQADLLN